MWLLSCLASRIREQGIDVCPIAIHTRAANGITAVPSMLR